MNESREKTLNAKIRELNKILDNINPEYEDLLASEGINLSKFRKEINEIKPQLIEEMKNAGDSVKMTYVWNDAMDGINGLIEQLTEYMI